MKRKAIEEAEESNAVLDTRNIVECWWCGRKGHIQNDCYAKAIEKLQCTPNGGWNER